MRYLDRELENISTKESKFKYTTRRDYGGNKEKRGDLIQSENAGGNTGFIDVAIYASPRKRRRKLLQ